MQVHQPPCILFDFSSINKPPGELNAVSDIRRAASPLPALLLVVVALFLSVTATIAEVALAAGSCDSMCNPGSSNGIGERSFPASCGEKPKADGLAERQHALTKDSTHIIYSSGVRQQCKKGITTECLFSVLTELRTYSKRLSQLGHITPGHIIVPPNIVHQRGIWQWVWTVVRWGNSICFYTV